MESQLEKGPTDRLESIPRQEADDVGERVHICIGATCNNNCIFCMEDDRDERARVVGAWSKDDVLDLIEGHRGTHEILFTSGEPTMNKDLPDYVRAAATGGYEVIGVISNGRRFSYMPFAVSLLRAGLNNIIVSIHGSDAATHDALTRTRGSFGQTLTGLRNLSALKGAFGFKLQTSTVVTEKNLADMAAFCDLMGTLDVDAHAFNVMMPDGGGRTHLERLMPRYSDVARVFGGLLPSIPPTVVERMALVDIPYCTTVGLPDSIRGYVERYFHYEPDGSFEKKARKAGVARTSPSDGDAGLFKPEAIQGDSGSFELVTRTYQETWVKSKRAECDGCRYNGICRGVWKPYTDRFGWDEFKAVNP